MQTWAADALPEPAPGGASSAAQPVTPAAVPSLPPPEVRVLIDISGSMKRTDPHRLRAPALRLLVGLLPPEAQAGLWFFGEDVRAVLEPAQVTESWRKSALKAAGQIGSNAPWTNIGAALEAALAGWAPTPAGTVRRHVILLTDGVVDIGKDEGVNLKARAAILDELLPRAQQLGVHLHTIALSAEADHDLLQALSRGTDGVYEHTEDAAELQRIFLRLFEKSAPRDALPLEDNAFTVDRTVAQLNLLVFRKPEAPPTRILLPDGRAVEEKTARGRPGWRWAREPGYDLITIDRPPPGRWRIEAEVDPDNRALILSDLRLNSLPLPNTLYLGEQLDWAVWFTEKGELLTDPRFHAQVVVELASGLAGEEPKRRLLADQGREGDQVAGDGIIHLRLGEGLRPGRQVLSVEAQSKTFTRLIRHDFDVDAAPLMQLDIQQAGPEAERHYRIVARPDGERVRLAESAISGMLDCAGAGAQPVMLRAEGEVFTYDLSPALSRMDCSLKLRLDGRLANGRPISWPAPAHPLPPLAAPAPESQEAFAWPLVAALVGGANLLLALLGWGVWRWLRGLRQRQVEDTLQGLATP